MKSSKFQERFSQLLDTGVLEPNEVAKAVGCSLSTVTRWRHGERTPDIISLEGIANLSGRSTDYLLGRTDEEQSEKPVRVYMNQQAAEAEFNEFIKTSQPKAAFLIQYSADYVKHLVHKLYHLPEKPRIFLLVKHPRTSSDGHEPNLDTITDFQRGKILAQLKILLDIYHFRADERVQIRCYKFPGSIRAIYLGNPIGQRLQSLLNQGNNKQESKTVRGLLNLSLYRYTDDVGVIGESNPHLHTYTSTAEGKTLYQLFEDSFVDLWKYSVSASDVLDENVKPSP